MLHVANNGKRCASARDVNHFAVPLPPLRVSLLLHHLQLAWCAKNKRPWSDPFDVPRSAIITGPSPHVTGSSTDAGSDTDLKWVVCAQSWIETLEKLKVSPQTPRATAGTPVAPCSKLTGLHMPLRQPQMSGCSAADSDDDPCELKLEASVPLRYTKAIGNVFADLVTMSYV